MLTVKAIKEAGCRRIYEENASGNRWDRPQLQKALEQMRVKDMLLLLESIAEVGAGFRRPTEAINTTTAAGRMLLQMLGAFVEFERSMVR